MNDANPLRVVAAAALLTGLACNALPSFGPATQVPSPTIVSEAADAAAEPTEDVSLGGSESEETAGTSGQDCLLGTWELVMSSYLEFLAAAAEGADEGLFEGIEGSMRLTFGEDGQVANDFDLSITVTGPEGPVSFQVTQSGSMGYSVEDGVISTTGGQLVTTSLSSPLGGVTTSGEAESATVPYTCDGDVLTVQIDSQPPLVWNRVP